MTNGVDDSQKYTEGCNALRHYSDCVKNIRTLTIVQGLVVLGSIFYLWGNKSIVFNLSLFGLLFTIILTLLHYNYIKHFKTFLDWIIDL